MCVVKSIGKWQHIIIDTCLYCTNIWLQKKIHRHVECLKSTHQEIWVQEGMKFHPTKSLEWAKKEGRRSNCPKKYMWGVFQSWSGGPGWPSNCLAVRGINAGKVWTANMEMGKNLWKKKQSRINRNREKAHIWVKFSEKSMSQKICFLPNAQLLSTIVC